MTDDQHDHAPGTHGAWQPTASGEYEVDGTAFVQLPDELLDGYQAGDDSASPLAAPGHGYVPPPIDVAHGGTEDWGADQDDPYGAPGGPDAAQWTDANALPQHDDARQHPGGPGGHRPPQDLYGYEPGMQLAGDDAGDGTGGPWHFDDGPAQGPQGASDRSAGAGGSSGPAGHHEAAEHPDSGSGAGVAGEWSIPLAQGDLPDASGEFTTAVLAEQWNGTTPPSTLPGGATAPWATGTGHYDTPGPDAAQEYEQYGADEQPYADAYQDDGYAQDGYADQGDYGDQAEYGDYQEEPGQQVVRPYMDAVGRTDGAGPAAQSQDTEPPADQASPDGYQDDDGLSDNAPRTTRLRGARPPRRPLQDTRVQEPLPQRPSEITQEFFPPAAPGGSTPVGTGEPAAGEPPARDDGIRPQDADDASRAAAEDTEPGAGSPEAPSDAGGPAHPSSEAHTPDDASGTPEPLAESALAAVTGPQEAPQDPAVPDTAGGPVTAEPSEDALEPDAAFADEHPLASYVLRVNGSDRPVTGAWIGESLLYVLRERLGLAGAKDGCSQGECGACNVQVDGRLVASCLVPAVTAAGSEVRTVEGLARDGQPSDVQRALAECGAVQCGFCVPGMAMTVHDLLEGNPRPTPLETRKALSGNLCRCSAYRGVLDAIDQVAAERRATAEAEAEAAHNAHADAAERSGGLRIPHQSGPGGAEAVESDDIAYATTQAQYRDAAAPEPYSYEDDGYDDGGRV